MKLITTIYDSIDILPQFLKYYSEIGVSCFIVGFYKGRNNPLYETALQHLQSYKYYTVLINEDCFTSPHNTQYRNIAKQFVQESEWHVGVDLDEFVTFPYSELNNLNTLSSFLEKNAYQCSVGSLVDRISYNGTLIKVNPNCTLKSQFPYICNITKHILQKSTRKVVLLKGWVAAENYPNLLPTVNISGTVAIHHFKWVSGLLERTRDRLTSQNTTNNVRNNCKRILEYFDANGGQIRLGSLQLSKVDKENW
jgi:hypothetical protein